MKSKHYMILAALSILVLFTLQMGVAGDQAAAAERPAGYFSITLVAPTNSPARVQHAQVITRELWKIGIDADLMLVGWDPLITRLFESVNFEGSAGDGYDIGFVGWTAGNPLNPAAISSFYHSSRIDKVAGGDNWYPINSSELDDLCDLIDSELDFDTRREYVREALDIVVWEVHPVMGLYQAANPFAIDAELNGFDAFRWGQPNLHVPELYYSNDQDTFKIAANARFIDLNPVLSNSYYDSLITQPTQAWTYQRDASMILKPVLATADPIAVGSNDTIASYIAVNTISADSPYAGADASTTWGPSPNVDTAQYNPYKTAADKSMFLINFREDIPFHDGWGYDVGDFNVTVEDLQWTLSYWIDEDVASFAAQGFIDNYGEEPTLAVQKINETMFKCNLRGPLANGQIGDWFDALSFRPLPRHILDPTFDATPWGGDVGVTPDGTTIAAYGDHSEYEYNTGEKPVVGVGAYQFIEWDETDQIAELTKFDQWGGYGANSLWNEEAYSQNNIETYAVTVYPSKEAAEIDLENGIIDGIDAQFQMGPDVPYLQTKPTIQVLLVEGGGIQTMGYNTYHPKLSNRYVRLAISHVVPAQKIVDFILGGLGSVNELVGIALANPYAPSEEEWNELGLPTSENTVVDGTEIKFQGHIRYDLDKAWALMEKAGYDMDPWREAVGEETRTEEDSPLPVLPILFAVMGLAVLRFIRRSRR
jgi:ABC-type oligopeptide transport system substrate-binding subunit